MYTPLGIVRFEYGAGRTTYRATGFVPAPALIGQEVSLIRPILPIAPLPTKTDDRIEPFVRPAIIPAAIVPETVYTPESVTDPDLTRELTKAARYGYTLPGWNALGVRGQWLVMRDYAEAESGPPSRTFKPTVVAGPDPSRQTYQEVGAGDHGGFEFVEPTSKYSLRQTETGLEFDDPGLPVRPKTTVAEPLPFGGVLKIALAALIGLFAYDQLIAKRKRPRRRSGRVIVRRRRRPDPKRFRMGWQ